MVWQMRDIHVSLEEHMLFGMSHGKVLKKTEQNIIKKCSRPDSSS